MSEMTFQDFRSKLNNLLFGYTNEMVIDAFDFRIQDFIERSRMKQSFLDMIKYREDVDLFLDKLKILKNFENVNLNGIYNRAEKTQSSQKKFYRLEQISLDEEDFFIINEYFAKNCPNPFIENDDCFKLKIIKDTMHSVMINDRIPYRTYIEIRRIKDLNIIINFYKTLKEKFEVKYDLKESVSEFLEDFKNQNFPSSKRRRRRHY